MSGRAEFIAAAFLLALMIVLAIRNVLHRGFDGDEPQHLHVIWEWTRGFVQYRDNFDNHMPLFHIMFAPIAGLIGERPTILYWMRYMLLPMYFVAAWCTYQIGTQLFSRRAGIWAVIGVVFYRGYSAAIEFRTDSLWTPIWLLCITVLVRGSMTARRALAAGLLFGFCFGVSMKSTVFLLSLLVSAPLTLVLVGREKLDKSITYLLQCTASFLAGTVLVPAIIMIFFALKGTWRDFRYGVFDFNFLADLIYKNQFVYKSHPTLAVVVFTMVLLIVVCAVRWISSVPGGPGLAFRRIFVLLLCVSYPIALQVFWPPISRTYRSNYPLVFVLFSSALLDISDKLSGRDWKISRILRLMPLPAFVALAEFFLLVQPRRFWEDRTRHHTAMLRSVLALTDGSDYVLDCKGETIFRQRCFRPVLERITMKAIQRGIMMDIAPQRCIETHTCVVATIMINRYPASTRRFVERNYLPVTKSLWVAGAILELSPENPHRSDFEVVIPASYKIISRNATVSGTLDGTSYDGARFLTVGPHTFESVSISDKLVLLWSRAVDRHFTPFDRWHR